MLRGVFCRVPCDIGLDPVAPEAGRWRCLHRLDRQVSDHPSDVDELAVGVAKTTAIGPAELEDAIGALQRFVIAPLATHSEDL